MEADQLIARVRACNLCADHLPLGPRPVVQLHPDARILIAGQAPGRRVHDSGVPFDDPSGVRLRAWLGVDDTTFYNPRLFALLPMGFCYPGTGSSGDLPPRPECAATWRRDLLDLLGKVDLTLVLGKYAMAWHLPPAPRATLTHRVQAWREHWPALLPLPHPSPRNNRWLARNPWFEAEVVPALQARVQALLHPG